MNNREKIKSAFKKLLDENDFEDISSENINLQNKLINFLNHHFEKIEENFTEKTPILFKEIIETALKNNVFKTSSFLFYIFLVNSFFNNTSDS